MRNVWCFKRAYAHWKTDEWDGDRRGKLNLHSSHAKCFIHITRSMSVWECKLCTRPKDRCDPLKAFRIYEVTFFRRCREILPQWETLYYKIHKIIFSAVNIRLYKKGNIQLPAKHVIVPRYCGCIQVSLQLFLGVQGIKNFVQLNLINTVAKSTNVGTKGLPILRFVSFSSLL